MIGATRLVSDVHLPQLVDEVLPFPSPAVSYHLLGEAELAGPASQSQDGALFTLVGSLLHLDITGKTINHKDIIYIFTRLIALM